MYWPLKNKLNTYVDKIAGVITYAANCRRDDAMSWLRFPGTSEFCDLGTGELVDGAFWWENQGYGVAVSDGKVFKVEEDGTKTEITGATLINGAPVSFADFGSVLFMANGSRVVKWDSAGATCAYLADVDAPTAVTHVVIAGLYLLALDTAGVVWHSEVNDPDTWLGEFFKADSRPDNTVAMSIDSDQILLYGTRTVQPFYQTGDAAGPWATVPNGTLNRGTGAAGSLSAEHIDLSYFFLDEERKVVRFQGGQPSIVSDPITTELQELSTISDARGFHLRCNGETFYCLVFPTAGKGWAFDYRRQDWTAIGGYADGAYTAPAFICGDHFKGWNKHLVGGTDGKLYEIGTQFSNNRMELRVRNNPGSDEQRKSCNKLRFRCKRGQGTAEAFLLLSYRDDGKATWKGERQISLGQTVDEDTYFYATATRLGQYRNREWRLVVSDDVPVVIVSVEET